MAGDWIKMRMDLPDDPAVYRLASITKLDRLSVVGRLYAFWAWADKHAVDGHVDGATSTVVDDITRHDGFADALVAVKWLLVGDDHITIPNHERHNGESAKERGLKNARQARWRDAKDAAPSTPVDAKPSTSPSTDASTREEKRREEKKEKSKEIAPSELPALSLRANPAPPPPFDGKNSEALNGKSVVPLAAHWELPESWGMDAEALGWQPREVLFEAEKFRQYWTAGKGTGTRRAVKSWRQSWSTWLGKAAERKIR